ncbi:MAG TPA: DNRLRE domain-containing protein, partial [Candidatus Lokiarchaeia archaeon]
LYTLTLQPGSEGIDAYVWGIWEWGEPNIICFNNYGSDSNLSIEYTEVGNGIEIIDIYKKRSYLKFNISSLPENAGIVNTILSLYVYYLEIPPFQIDYKVNIFKVNSLWSEGGIAWYNQPQIDDLVQGEVVVNEEEMWWDFDITSLVQYWYDSGENNGLCLKNPYENSNQFGRINMFSSDYEEDPSMRPKLKIEYNLNQ